jgi:hypothetical protein
MNIKTFQYRIIRNNEFSQRSIDFSKFTEKVIDHIENYTVPQYGDKGNDLATDYTPEICLHHIQKYAARFGKNARIGQEKLDLIKIAHYAQLAYDALCKNEKL